MKEKLSKVLLIILLSVMLVLSLPFIFYGADGFSFYGLIIKGATTPRPPKPEITHGEFPFKLVYEINGEEKVIEDTLICKYDGVEWSGDYSIANRKWKTSFKSGNEKIILLNIDEKNVIYFSPGPAGYYMSEYVNEPWIEEYTNDVLDPYCNIYRNDIEENPYYVWPGWPVEKDELINIYGIKIISWEPSLPIENRYE